jgi:transposase
MTTSYLPYEPRQQQLLPAALQDWLPEGHLAYYISDVIHGLDFSMTMFAAGPEYMPPYRERRLSTKDAIAHDSAHYRTENA